jgi:glycosyltransferase 2 family protein
MDDPTHNPRRRLASFLKSRTARRISTFVAVILTVLILGFMLFREREVLFSRQWSFNLWFLLAAFALHTLALFLASYIWVGIINSLGEKIGFWQHFQYYCVSMLAKRLPGTVWYIAYRSQMYAKEGISASATSLASGVEFALILISGMIISVMFAIPILQQYQAGAIGVILLFLLAVFFLQPRVLAWFFRKLHIDRSSLGYRDIATWTLMFIGVRVLLGGLMFAIARIIYPLPLQDLSYMIGGYNLVSVLANALIFMPTNLGFTEVTFSIVLSNIVPSSIAVIIAVLSRALIMLFELIWALISIVTVRIRLKKDSGDDRANNRTPSRDTDYRI